jgi:hypothetical protein
MLCYLIQATPKLRQFVKASWASGSSVVTLASRYGVLSLDSALINIHSGQLSNPTTAPVASAASGGTFPDGTVLLAYANRNAAGTTALSPTLAVALTASQKLSVNALALPTGATSRDWYVSKYPGSGDLVFSTNANGSAFSITDLPDSSDVLPPLDNTTGEELLRVAAAYASNDQDPYPVWTASTLLAINTIILPTTPNGHKYKVTTAGTTGSSEPTYPLTSGGTVTNGSVVLTEFGATILGQAGLTKGNIHQNTFKSPLGGKQSSTNQITGTFYDSTDDFASTPLEVNDYSHQTRIRKTNKKEVDLSGFDNYHQASRYLNFLLSKNREGDWFAEWETNPAGMLHEEGDVVCVSSANMGLVNAAVRIEELGIGAPPPSGHYDVRITARKYSTLMFSDQVRQHSIKLPTTLKHTFVLDTLAQLMDLPLWRDSDRDRPPGFHLVIRRADGIGDWRGAQMWMNTGDGYKRIADVDVEGTTGTAVTALPTTSAVTYNNSDTVRVQVGASAVLSTKTDAEMLGGANVARLGGNIFRFQTATLFDAVTNTYDLSGLQTGMFGTEREATSVGDEFALLDSSVYYFPLDASLLDKEIGVKLVTLRQDVADATEHLFTWTGLSRQAPEPLNFRSSDDSTLDTLIEFDLRDFSLGGLRDGRAVLESGVKCELRLTDSSYVPLDRPPMVILPGQVLPAALVDVTASGSGDLDAGGDLPFGSTASNFDTVAAALQLIPRTGNFVEADFEVVAEDDGSGIAGGVASMGLMRGDRDYRDVQFTRASCLYAVELHHDANDAQDVSVTTATLRIWVGGVNVKTVAGAISGDRYRIMVNGSEARFYRNYTPGGKPLYVSAVPPAFPLRAIVGVRKGRDALLLGHFLGTAQVTGAVVTCAPAMKTFYSSAQRVNDYGSTGATAYGLLYEINEFGKGQELRVSF